jgi:serine/threonine-protein kinase
MLRPELARQPNVVERFRTEAVTLAKLNHSNVATLHSFFRQGEDFFMVMEFVRGKTLDEIIRAQGAMQCNLAIELFCMALEGIDHAHKMGIVHRDIKPANMMVTESGSIKVMDFGIARVLGTDRLTKAGHLIGTVEYMSPEQVRGEETDARSDIYSLGILLYEMLTGRVPFNSTSEYELMRCQIEVAPTPPRSFAPHIPLPVEQAIMRALAKKREARYQSASDFRAMLIQKRTGAVTRPLIDPSAGTGSFAAPATKADLAMRMTPVSGEVVQENTLTSDQTPVIAATSAEARSTQPGSARTAAVQSRGAPGYSAQSPVALGERAKPTLLSTLNWKHYASAGVILIAITAGTVALVAGIGKPSTVPPQPATPAEAQTPTSPPEQTDPVPAASRSDDSLPGGSAVLPAASGNQPVNGSASLGASSGRAKAGVTKVTDVPSVSQQETPAPATPQTQTSAPQPPQAPSQAQSSQTHPTTKPDTAASQKPAEKKEPDKKPEEKKRGLFGKIKDAITGGGEKKKDDPKKP